MTRDELLELHKAMAEKGRTIMAKKNHDYAGANPASPFANFEASEIINIQPEKGLLLRTLDKIKRLNTFVESGALLVPGEGFEDSCIDIMNYMVLLAGMNRAKQEQNQPTLPLQQEAAPIAIRGDRDDMLPQPGRRNA
jgi:hypothetical protein